MGGDEVTDTLSLVVEEGGRLLGHVVFSPVTLPGRPEWHGSILAPLGVLSARHGEGIGSRLVREGLQQLSRAGVGVVLVYGDPAYYGRFGFDAAEAEPFLPPHTLDMPFGWQALVLDEDARIDVPAQVTVVEPLDDAGLW
jgi:putative acetyltransferase